MESHFQKDTKKRRVKNAGTFLYAPEKEPAEPSAQDTEPEDASEAKTVKAAPKRITVQKDYTVIGRIGIIFSAFLIAGMLLFILSGYERISRAYADINSLNTEIEDIKLHISELNVSIECAVTIEDAEQAAIAAGMIYPSQSQILVPGQAIPPSGSLATTTAPDSSGESTETADGSVADEEG